MKKMLRFILLLLVVLGIAAGAGIWKVRQLAQSKLLIKEETIFTLEAGTGRMALGEQLYGDKVINRPRVFQWLLRLEPELSHFKAGTYRFMPNMTVRDMLQLLGSGSILRESLAAQQLLAQDWGIGADVWSCTSFTELARQGQDTERHNLLHPTAQPRVPFVTQQLAGGAGALLRLAHRPEVGEDLQCGEQRDEHHHQTQHRVYISG